MTIPLAGTAAAQDDDDDEMDDVDFGDDDDDDTGDDDDAPPTMAPTSIPAGTGGGEVDDADPRTLVCDGGWRFPLVETREEIGPARFFRQLGLQRDIQFAGAAFGYCAEAAGADFKGRFEKAIGPCSGLIFLADQVDVAASNLFRLEDKHSCECLTRPVEPGGSCEGLREQLTTLRRYDAVLVDRAELVLATQVCAMPERGANFQLRAACERLESVIKKHYDPKGGGLPGQFSLSAPLPDSVAYVVNGIRKATDNRWRGVLPENFIGIRQSVCKIPIAPIKQNTCSIRDISKLEDPANVKKPAGPACPPGKICPQDFMTKMQEVTWGMCNELALADVNANTCRDADVYVDERGQLHLNRPLTTRKQRRNATLCIDISDFDEKKPLMITLGLDPTGSVPKRVWPGETLRIGELINKSVTRDDILHIHVMGKARGVSLTEVLRVNGLPPEAIADNNDEACRIARSWVPVVDHEVPVGIPSQQAIIPIKFDRGRDGETRTIKGGDYVVLWIRDIEPSGGIVANLGGGQVVGYRPPPLLGAEPVEGDNSTKQDPNEPGKKLRGGSVGVDNPVLPRRARYPGSRVLRLGSPAGSHNYDIKVCRVEEVGNDSDAARRRTSSGVSACDGKGDDVLLDEKIFVHGDSHFGVKFHFGYTYFPIEVFEARRTPAAVEAGGNTHEVVKVSEGLASYDVAALLAVYPFGRNPRAYSYNPLSKNYWKHFALLAGFTVRTLEPWEDFYLGMALPIANGVSLSGLAHISRRDLPVGLEAGMLIEGNDVNQFGSKNAIAVGYSVGMTFDLDLFERAFFNTWNRISGKDKAFMSATSRDLRGLQPPPGSADRSFNTPTDGGGFDEPTDDGGGDDDGGGEEWEEE